MNTAAPIRVRQSPGLPPSRSAGLADPQATGGRIERAARLGRHGSSALAHFLAEATARSRVHADPVDCVLALAPLMLDLLAHADSFLQPQHRLGEPHGYRRNRVYAAADGSLSLYAMVWLPGQWTPIHDHGCWGVVGVAEGVLEERSYVRASPDRHADHGIDLVPGGTLLLRAGGVTTFVPEPDHIHVTGVPLQRPPVLSLHLYGRTMSEHNVYDIATGTRQRIPVAHHGN